MPAPPLPVPEVPEDRTAAIAATFHRVAEQVNEAMRQLSKVAVEALQKIEGLMAKFREAANQPVAVAGLEARFYVRGALDPTYRSEDARDRLVVAIMAGQTLRDDDWSLLFLTRENRARVAASVLTGWQTHRGPAPASPYAAHRLWGAERVEVSCG